MRKVFIEGNKT